MSRQTSDMGKTVSLDEGIALLESGKADASICIDFGEGVFGQAEDENDLDGLLQRARGLRLIRMMVAGEEIEQPVTMRSGKPALHPLVEEILDALRNAD
ncbi:MAG: hypothetical protein RLN72_04920 [Henriciella sp.]